MAGGHGGYRKSIILPNQSNTDPSALFRTRQSDYFLISPHLSSIPANSHSLLVYSLTLESNHGTIWSVWPALIHSGRSTDEIRGLAWQRENVWRHFKFTKTTARLSLIWGVLVPVGVFAFAQRQDVSHFRSSFLSSLRLTWTHHHLPLLPSSFSMPLVMVE